MSASQSEETILSEAMLRPPEERAGYLAEATRDNPELREEVESLLRCHGAGQFLEQAAAAELHPTIRTAPLTERPGDRIGRYKLLERIGEGGCGVVYVAEQTEPVRRRVALKIVKLGMDTRSVIARFEAERQALALMDHPNIAKVFDAGATDTGRPYFVMELVRGTKITEFCDEKKLPTTKRLDLFVQVCNAIQHAHQKGIIHRDLKPSNILLSEDDGRLVPKVIDFGVAKATGGQLLTDKTIYTAFEQFIGTPAYMSPEQALMTNADIDTRSDIYALGVLLYELMTGRTPFDAKELFEIGLDEMRRTIREAEPPKPSTRVSALLGPELRTTAQHRGLEAPRLVSELRGDLDWIVMKCLEKDRGRRYETANGLAMDIRRHLDDEPVTACPPGTLYRFQKFVRRNKLVFSAGAAVAASLLIGLGVSTWMFFQERAAVQRAVAAEKEQSRMRERAEAGNDFLWDILSQASSRKQAIRGFKPDPNLTVRKALERAAERIDQYKDRALSETFIRHTIGQLFYDFDDARRAIEHLEPALALWEAGLSDNPQSTDCAKGRLQVMGLLGGAYNAVWEFEKARSISQEALEGGRIIYGPDDPEMLDAKSFLASAYAGLGEFDEAIRLGNEVLKLAEATEGQDAYAILISTNQLADIYRDAGKPELALPLAQEALARGRATLGPDHPATLDSMSCLGRAYLDTGELEQARVHFEEALPLMKNIFGADHYRTIWVMCDLARVHREAARCEEAATLMEEALGLVKAGSGPVSPGTLQTVNEVAEVYPRVGKLDEAVDHAEELVNRQKAALGPDHPDTLVLMDALGRLCTDNGRLAQALPVFEELVERSEASLGPDHEITLKGRRDLGVTYFRMERPDKAVPVYRDLFERAKTRLGEDAPGTLDAMADLGTAYSEGRQQAQARSVLEPALALAKDKLSPGHPTTLKIMRELARVYTHDGDPERAVPLAEETWSVSKKELGPNHRDTLRTMYFLASALAGAGHFDDALLMFGQALDRMTATLPRNDNLISSTRAQMGMTYQTVGNLESALPCIKDAVHGLETELGADHPQTRRVMAKLADLLARLGKWEEAAHWFERLRELDPEDHWLWRKLAVLYVASGQFDAYRKLCRQGAEQFGTTSDPAVAERMAKDCLLLPASGADPAVVSQMVKFAADASDHPYAPWFQLVKGLAEYRQEQFASAVECVNRTLAERRVPQLETQARMVLAMAQSQLNQNDQARGTYAKGAAIARLTMPQTGDGSLGSDWLDWIIARILMDEAEALLTSGPESDGQPPLEVLVERELASMAASITADSPKVLSVLVPPISEWRWLHPRNGVDPAVTDADFHTTFFTDEFDDGGWQHGTDSGEPGGGFGYGDEWFEGVDIGLPGVEDEEGKRNGKSAYFRHRFETTEKHTNLELRCQFDDGIIVYLDGVEVARLHMNEGPEAYELPAARPVGGEWEKTTLRIMLAGCTLPPGKHLLAISLHNPAEPSTDLRIGGISLVEVVAPSNEPLADRIEARSGSASASDSAGTGVARK